MAVSGTNMSHSSCNVGLLSFPEGAGFLKNIFPKKEGDSSKVGGYEFAPPSPEDSQGSHFPSNAIRSFQDSHPAAAILRRFQASGEVVLRIQDVLASCIPAPSPGPGWKAAQANTAPKCRFGPEIQ